MPNTSPWTDQDIQNAAQDRLGFEHYCQVLTGIVQEADTPLTIGIFGPWGSGKTSLMRLVTEQLGQAEPPPLTVWFNAWQYDREEALWRALVIRVLNALRPGEEKAKPVEEQPTDKYKPDLGTEAKARQALNQRLDDLEASLYQTVEREELGGVSIEWDKLLKGSVLGLTHLSLSVLPGLGPVLGKMMEKAQEKISGEDLTMIFEAVQRERRKIHRQHIQSLEQFRGEFEQIVREEVLAKERRLVVFIDDLDRCLPEKAITVFEALKLFLEVPGCLFVIGADREVIQRGIRVKYKDFLVESDDPAVANRRIPITGDDYLEKIVQLPFHLLPLDEARVKQFVSKSDGALAEGCADLFAAGLEANPRKIKRSLNIFRMLHKLADLRRDEFPAELNPQLLAKVVIIQSRYRDLYNDLVEFPALLQDLERTFQSETTESSNADSQPSTLPKAGLTPEPAPAPSSLGKAVAPTLLEKYQDRRPLRRLLTLGARFSDLPLTPEQQVQEIKRYLYLTYSAADSSTTPAQESLQARWPGLLSHDPSKIRSEVAALDLEETETVNRFRQQLLQVLEQAGERYTMTERLSAGTALALLGDPRNFEEMIAVPAGEYPLGEDNASEYIEGFKIAKYPVTNKQYENFLKENPNHPNPDHFDQATRTCPPEVSNHPVTYVTWADANAYCGWAAKRLPTAKQWEAAATFLPEQERGIPIPGNVLTTGLEGTSPVGAFPETTSPLSPIDMIGNVWEWTQDQEVRQGKRYHVRKGGGWDAALESWLPKNNLFSEPDFKDAATGFRVAE